VAGGTRVNARGARNGQRAVAVGAIHAAVLRQRPRSRRRRFAGPFGIAVVALIGIGTILAGNGALPLSTVAGGVAGATHAAPSPSSAADLVGPTPSADVRADPSGPADDAGADPTASADPAAGVPIDGLTGYRWPLANARITLPFGPTPWGGWVVDGEKFHDGIDLATFCGDRIVAAHDGVVLAAGRHYDDQMGWIGDLAGYYARLDAKQLWTTLPIVVVIDDGNGYRSLYAHFGKIVVKKGQTVTAGSLLGYEGRTGRASGCHLHYGLFSPTETSSFTMDPVSAKRMKLPGLEIARVDPQLVLPARAKPASKSRSSGPSPASPTP